MTDQGSGMANDAQAVPVRILFGLAAVASCPSRVAIAPGLKMADAMAEPDQA